MSHGVPFASVYFDCDSTLSAIEGIDELTGALPEAQRTEVRNLTRAAMDGQIALESVYGRRLELVRPQRNRLAAIGKLYAQHQVADADRVIAALRWLGKSVGIVSGGLAPAVLPFAATLGIAPELVHAVEIRFDAAGDYLDYQPSALTRGGGKRELLARLPIPRPVAFVGDGITDLEAAPAVDRFIGFGGVVRRDAVQRQSEFYVTSASLAAILPHLLTRQELDRLAAHSTFHHLASPS